MYDDIKNEINKKKKSTVLNQGIYIFIFILIIVLEPILFKYTNITSQVVWVITAIVLVFYLFKNKEVIRILHTD